MLGVKREFLSELLRKKKVPFVRLWQASENASGKSYSRGYSLSEAELVTGYLKGAPSAPEKKVIKVKGIRYATLATYIALRSIPVKKLTLLRRMKQAGDLKSVRVRNGASKTLCPAYPLAEMDALFKEFGLQKKIQPLGEGFCLYRRKRWGTSKALCKEKSLNKDALNEIVEKKKTPYIKAHMKGRGPCKWYDVERFYKDAQVYLAKKRLKDDPIDAAVLRAEAIPLVAVLKTLRSEILNFTADDFWHALRTKWPKSELNLALKEFRESGKTDRFKKLFE